MFVKNTKIESIAEAVKQVVEASPVKIPTPTGTRVLGTSYGNSAKTHRDQISDPFAAVKGPGKKDLENIEKPKKKQESFSAFTNKLLNSLEEDKQIQKQIDEVLKKDASAGDWIHDFVHSDNPKFAGKSKAERKKMALGAYYAKQNEEVEQLDELSPNTLTSYADKARSQGRWAHGVALHPMGKLVEPNADAIADKRFAGAKRADAKASKKMMSREEVEQFDEAAKPNELHVVDDGVGRYKVRAVGSNHAHDIKVGEHLTNKHLDDFHDKGVRVMIHDYFDDSAERLKHKQVDEAKKESKKDFDDRQKRLAAASSETAKDPERLKKLSKIPGYTAAMDLAKKTTKEEVEQIDEIGNTPAGQKALQAVNARGTKAMDTWNKKPESGYTKAPKKTIRQFAGAMNADRRQRGFGIDASAKGRAQRQIDYAKRMRGEEVELHEESMKDCYDCGVKEAKREMQSGIPRKSKYEKGTAEYKESLRGYNSVMKKEEVEQQNEALIGNQKKIDKNHNGKIDAQDFKILRGKKVDEVLNPSNKTIDTLAGRSKKVPAEAKLDNSHTSAKTQLKAEAKTPEHDDVPFDPPYRRTSDDDTVTDKSGAKHTPMSRAKHLAQTALQRVKNDLKAK